MLLKPEGFANKLVNKTGNVCAVSTHPLSRFVNNSFNVIVLYNCGSDTTEKHQLCYIYIKNVSAPYPDGIRGLTSLTLTPKGEFRMR